MNKLLNIRTSLATNCGERIPLRATRIITLMLCVFTLSGCEVFKRVSEIGSKPELSPISDSVLAASERQNKILETMISDEVAQSISSSEMSESQKQAMLKQELIKNYPLLAQLDIPKHNDISGKNSLWHVNAKSLVEDQRAKRRGDILTIMVNISDSAKFDNTTSGSRLNSEDLGLNNFAGFGESLEGILPEGALKENLIDVNSSNSTSGIGAIDRSETLEIKVAATITRVMPNGNLFVEGRQEVRVNSELRELLISGIVRPADVTPANIVESAKIAEARISYGGRGYLQHLQQPRYGQQLLDALLPF